jgi:hypothetical protein
MDARFSMMLMALALAAFMAVSPALAQKPGADAAKPAATQDTGPVQEPRAGEKAYEQSRRLLQAIDSILTKAAQERSQAKDLPSRERFVIPPLWTETREDREKTIRALLDSALEIVSDAPVVQMQEEIAARSCP